VEAVSPVGEVSFMPAVWPLVVSHMGKALSGTQSAPRGAKDESESGWQAVWLGRNVS